MTFKEDLEELTQNLEGTRGLTRGEGLLCAYEESWQPYQGLTLLLSSD